MLRRLRLVAKALLRRHRFERDMADEMRFHLEAYADDLERSGLSRADAERRARLEFGGMVAAEEECRQARGLQRYDELRQDLRYAARQMVKAPGLTLAAVVSLALGIGANSAIFSVIDAVLYRTLPVTEPHELHFFGHRGGQGASLSANYPLLARYRGLDAFSGVTAYSISAFPVAVGDGVELVTGQFVSGNYHAVVRPSFVMGRGFTTEPDRPAGGAPIAVISDAFWERRFARRPDVIGQTLMVAGRPTTIVGITAPGFHGLASGSQLDITVPLWVRMLDDPAFLEARDGWTSFTLVGRRKPGVPVERARATVTAVFQQYWMEPENAWARRDGEAPRTGELVSAARGNDRLRQRYGTSLLVLMGMVAVVLLIACANVANLLLARATVRRREIALRMSIGAARGRLIRQHLTESLLLACTGGVLGLLVAASSMRVIHSLLGTGRNAVFVDARMDLRVLAGTGLIAVAAGVIFGLAPALRATRVDLIAALKAGPEPGSRRLRPRAARSLVVAQVALCVLLVTTAGLLGGSLRNLRAVDPGFDRSNVVMFNIETYDPSFTTEERARFYDRLLAELQQIPGVASVALAKRTPVDLGTERRRFEIPGVPPRAGQEGVSGNVVTPDFFRLFGITLLRGREFTAADRAGRENVAIISAAAARVYFGDADPVGRTALLGGAKLPVTIVGLVTDVRHEGLRESPPPMLYSPLAQPDEAFDGTFGYPGHVTAIVRTVGAPFGVATAGLRLVKTLDARVPVSYVRTMERQLDDALQRERLLAYLSGSFGMLALVLSFVGLFGVMSYGVAQRTREIGICMALGASRLRVLRQVLGEATLLSAAGVVIGLGVALAATRVIGSFLFGVTPHDPPTLAAVTLLLSAVALVAGYVPARRAAQLDPTRAMRSE